VAWFDRNSQASKTLYKIIQESGSEIMNKPDEYHKSSYVTKPVFDPEINAKQDEKYPRIAIVDTQITGHHLEYIYGLCNEISKNNIKNRIDVYCDEHIYEYIKRNDLSALAEEGNFNIKSGVLSKIEGNWFEITFKAIRNIKKLQLYDNIIFLNLNAYLPALYLISKFKTPLFSFSGILFNPHVRKSNSNKNFLRDHVLQTVITEANCRIFILNDKEAVYSLNKKYSTDAFEVLPDPIPKFYYSNIHPLQNNVKKELSFTMIGAISNRKGIYQFLKAIKFSKSNNKFIIAGSVNKENANLIAEKVRKLSQAGIDINLYNKFLSNKEFAQFIVDSDVIVMPYLTDGASSGILGHAAYNKKTVIGPNYGLLGEIIEKYDLGVTLNPRNVEKFAELIANNSWIEVAKNSVNDEFIRKKTYSVFFQKLIK